jgi:hypothetical protein
MCASVGALVGVCVRECGCYKGDIMEPERAKGRQISLQLFSNSLLLNVHVLTARLGTPTKFFFVCLFVCFFLSAEKGELLH